MPEEPESAPGAGRRRGARGPYRTGVRRREQILVVATAVFARRGYGNASLREIAVEVGVTPAALLRHFGSKEELLFAVLERFDEQMEESFAAPIGLAYFRKLAAIMDAHKEHPGLVELLLTICTEASDPGHPAHGWVARRYRRIVDDASASLRRAIADGEARQMDDAAIEGEARALIAVMDGLELQWIAEPELDLGALFRPVYEAALRRWGIPADPAG